MIGKIIDNLSKYILITLGIIIVGPVFLLMVATVFFEIRDYISNRNSNYKGIREKPFECGLFGDKLMQIDRRYLFFTRVIYDGVDYWSGSFLEDHATKGCEDQILSATFEVKWPDMTPSDSFRYWKDPDFVSISLQQRSEWPIEKRGESKDFFDKTEHLIFYLSRTDRFKWGEDISIKEINSLKKFNSDLELYEMTAYDNENSKTIVFWQEVEGKGVSLTIECLYYKKSDWLKCKYNTHIPDYGRHTSYIKINFHADLLPYWKDIHHDAMQLIKSFTVRGDAQ